MSRCSSGLGRNSTDVFRDRDDLRVVAVLSDVDDDET